jgi:hypothetical protein
MGQPRRRTVPLPLRFGGILRCYGRVASSSLFREMQLTQRCVKSLKRVKRRGRHAPLRRGTVESDPGVIRLRRVTTYESRGAI